MTTAPPARRPRRAWWILLVLGALSISGAAVILFGPGFRLAPPVAFGEALTVDVAPGDHAIYVTPSDEWSRIECTGVVPGDVLMLRIDMTQQGLVLPERWDARGSFESPLSGEANITCDGPVADGRFTVGPPVTLVELAGVFALCGLGALLAIVGLIVRVAGSRRA